MTSDAINEECTALASAVQQTGSKRLTIRMVRSLLPTIEAALTDGQSHESIYSRLHSEGYEVTWHYYQLMLHRARKEASSSAPASGLTPLSLHSNGSTPASVGLSSPPPPPPSITNSEVTWDVKSPVTW